MKKALSLFILPALAACIITMALHQITGYSHINSVTMLDHSQTDLIHALLGFLFGFLPCLIYGLAANWMEANQPQTAPDTDNAPAAQAPAFTGEIFTFPAQNCAVRVKAYHNYSTKNL